MRGGRCESAEACIALMGPAARTLLQALSPDDVSNATFPFATQRSIEIGMAHVRAHRISYVGELGFELYLPTEFARHVLEYRPGGGKAAALRLAGLLAMDALRLEKAYRHFGHDISDEDHVLEAGLGFAVKIEKQRGRFGHFIGRDAVLPSATPASRAGFCNSSLPTPSHSCSTTNRC